jgi:hypothetical protein
MLDMKEKIEEIIRRNLNPVTNRDYDRCVNELLKLFEDGAGK